MQLLEDELHTECLLEGSVVVIRLLLCWTIGIIVIPVTNSVYMASREKGLEGTIAPRTKDFGVGT